MYFECVCLRATLMHVCASVSPFSFWASLSVFVSKALRLQAVLVDVTRISLRFLAFAAAFRKHWKNDIFGLSSRDDFFVLVSFHKSAPAVLLPLLLFPHVLCVP